MHDPEVVRGLERLGNLRRHRQGVGEWNWTVRDLLRERRSLDELEHQRVPAGALFDAVDGGDARMVERAKHLRLAAEPRQAIRIGHDGGGKDLERDLAIQPGVASAIHLAHPTRAERADDEVCTESRAGEQGQSDV